MTKLLNIDTDKLADVASQFFTNAPKEWGVKIVPGCLVLFTVKLKDYAGVTSVSVFHGIEDGNWKIFDGIAERLFIKGDEENMMLAIGEALEKQKQGIIK